MRSKIEMLFTIDEENLDNSGIEIMNNLIAILSKLATYETSAGPARDIQLAIDLADLIDRCQTLQKSYEANIL